MDSVVNATVVVVLGFGVGLHSKAELCSILFADDRAILNTTNPHLIVNDITNTLELR